MSFNKNIVNKLVLPKGTSSNVRQGPGTNSAILLNVKSGESAGRASGSYMNMKDGIWYQIIFLKPVNGKIYGYGRSDVFKLSEPVSNPNVDGEGLVRDLAKQDYLIFHSILRTKEILSLQKKQGKNITKPLGILKDLYKRWYLRKRKMETSGLLKTENKIEDNYMRLYVKYQTSGFSGLGAVVETGTAIAIVGVLAIGAALWVAFYADKKESDVDLDISKEFEALLATTDPENAAAIVADIEGQIDKSYEKGYRSGKLGGWTDIMTPLLIAGAGFFLVTKFLDSQEDKKYQRRQQLSA